MKSLIFLVLRFISVTGRPTVRTDGRRSVAGLEPNQKLEHSCLGLK